MVLRLSQVVAEVAQVVAELAEIRKLLGAAAPSSGAVKAGTVQFVTNCVPAGRCASVKSEGNAACTLQCTALSLRGRQHCYYMGCNTVCGVRGVGCLVLFSVPSWFPAHVCACVPLPMCVWP